MAILSRAALTADESHDAWLSVFAAITSSPADARRAPCPNCGFFAVRFQFVAAPVSRIGFCALWCDNCGHGHSLSRVRVPDDGDFLPLDASEKQLRAAIPEFWDATSAAATARTPATVAARLTQLRPRAIEYEVLKTTGDRGSLEQHLLSPREIQVVNLVREGLHARQIADRLGVSRATVTTHIQRIYLKLGREAAQPLNQ